MRTLLLTSSLALLGACSGGTPSTDAGSDAGIDAGAPVCLGVPARFGSAFLCAEVDRGPTAWCRPDLASQRARFPTVCDGGVEFGQCAALDSMRWVYGFPGDWYECFYAPDGGLVGFINASDHGTVIGGQVGDCPLTAQACDGG